MKSPVLSREASIRGQAAARSEGSARVTSSRPRWTAVKEFERQILTRVRSPNRSIRIAVRESLSPGLDRSIRRLRVRRILIRESNAGSCMLGPGPLGCRLRIQDPGLDGLRMRLRYILIGNAVRRRRRGDREPAAVGALQRARPRSSCDRGRDPTRAVRHAQADAVDRSAVAAAVFRVRGHSHRRRNAVGHLDPEQTHRGGHEPALRRGAGCHDRMSGAARPAVRSRGPAGGSLDGGGRRRPGAFRDAGGRGCSSSARRRHCSTGRARPQSSTTSSSSNGSACMSCSRPKTARGAWPDG